MSATAGLRVTELAVCSWSIRVAGLELEVERHRAGAWRVASGGRERVDGSLVRAVAAVCGADADTPWVALLVARLGAAPEPRA